ncbi:MAG: DEAD/DEAH box helicase [Deltaproteobacteria bacterium]|nr:DEAD/DEAH box helicase [Deltaproteobacteria bacterium]
MESRVQGIGQHPELLDAVCLHLQKELDSEYSVGISRRGKKVSAEAVQSAVWDADEIKVCLMEKQRSYQVRLVLPLFEENAYALTVCSCMEDRYLDDQRCHHMWFAQHYLLSEMKRCRKPEEQKPLWLRLRELYISYQSCGGGDTALSLAEKESQETLCWLLQDDFSLVPALRRPSAAIQAISWKRFLQNSSLWWCDQAAMRIAVTQLQSRQEEAGASSDYLMILCEAGIPVTFSGDLHVYQLQKDSLRLAIEPEGEGLRVHPRALHAPADHFISPGAPTFSGLLSVDSVRKVFYLVDVADPLAPLLTAASANEGSAAGEWLPAAMRREYCGTLTDWDYAGLTIHEGQSSALHQKKPLAPGDGEGGRDFYFRLTPLEPEGVYIEFLIRPLNSASYQRFYVRPGSGHASLYDYSEFPPLLCLRNLREEVEQSRQILQSLSDGEELIRSAYELRLMSDYEALSLLDELEAHPERKRIYLEWPEACAMPDRFRLKAAEDEEGPLQVNVRKSADWFDMGGGLWVAGQYVDLKTLIIAFRNEQRFIKLSHDRWFRVSDSLRQRLHWLSGQVCDADLIEGERAGYRPDWSELTGEAIAGLEFSGDSAFQQLRAKLLAAESFEPAIPESFRAEFRPYQREGFRWLSRLSRWASGAILADDMGLGKTVQTICLLCERVTQGPSLILCPSSLCDNWRDEILKFSDQLQPRLLRDGYGLSLPEEGPLPAETVLIASYGLLRHHRGSLPESCRWGTLVLDEAQALKNHKSKTFMAVRRLDVDFCLALSGTPVENRLSDLWSLFQLVSPGLLGRYDSFCRQWGGDGKREETGQSSLDALKALIRPFVLRRTKQECLRDLPPKSVRTLSVYLSPEERQFYDVIRMRAIAELKSAGEEEESGAKRKIRALAWLTKLRQLVSHPRLLEPDWSGPASKEKEFFRMAELLGQSDKKTLVFSQFPSFLELLKQGLTARGYSVLLLRGSTPVGERKVLADAFQSGEADFFLISLKAGGTGLNLTRAEVVMILDPWWNPAAEAQAMDRAYRIGQKNPVTVFRMIAGKTIEDKISDLQEGKKELADRILEGSEHPEDISLPMLESLFSDSSSVSSS